MNVTNYQDLPNKEEVEDNTDKYKDEDDDLTHFPIAIVGIGCAFPGAYNLQQYRKVLLEEIRSYSPVPDERWSREKWHSGPGPYKKGYANSDVIGTIDYLHSFDNNFFNISPKEMAIMDKQQFRIMETTQLALDDAGIVQDTFPRNTAVFISTSIGQMPIPLWENTNLFSPYSLTGGSHSVAANRINYFYNVIGPSLATDSGSSSALYNIHIGLLALWNGECKAVVAGGVNCMWIPHFHISRCATGYFSPNGEARPFDKNADGAIRSEGCGIVVMKPLHDAIKDGDHVHCIIRGSVFGYHGDSPNMELSNADPVSEITMNLYQNIGLSPDQVDYVETSASGNPKDDVMEAEVISRVFSSKKNPIKIGSCKANIGHSEQASGMASIMKCALMLSNREYYPQANFSEFNSSIQAHKWNLEIQKKYEKYDSPKPMLIGINSVSTTGQVVHVILEEFKNNESDISADDLSGWHFGVSGEKGRKVVVVLSAKSKEALKAMATQWLRYKNTKDDAQIVASWLASKRNHYKHRLIIITNSGDDFREKIQDFLEGCPNDQVIEGTAPVQFQSPKICFVFPGQGQQWEDMGRSLYANEPVYKDVIDKCDEIWKNEGGYSFLETFRIFIPRDTKDGSHPSIHEMLVCPPAIVAHQMALSTLLQHWGIKPDMVIGHSLGEVAAAYVAGTINFEECMINIFHRASNQCKMSGTGAMAAARLTPEEGERFCLDYDNVYVACYNSSDNVTLSGGNDIIKRLAEENPKKIKVIRVKAPCHTIALRAVRDDFFDRLKGKYEPKMSNHITIYSTVTKDIYHGPHGTEYWWNNIEKPVFFFQANEAIFRDHGNDVIFVEIAAAPTLLSSIRQTAKKLGINPAGYVSFSGRGVDDWVAAVKGILQLYLMEFPINWENITRNCARYVDIPQYPFQRNDTNVETEEFYNHRLNLEEQSYSGRYGEIDIQMHPFLADCRFKNNAVMPASGWIEYLIELVDNTNPSLTDVTVLTTPKVFEMNVLGQYEKLYVEAKIKHNDLVLQANAQPWNFSPEQPRGIYAIAIRSPSRIRELGSKLCINSIFNRCTVRVGRTRFYEKLWHMGWQYGDSFRVVREIRIRKQEAIGLLDPEVNKHEKIKTITLDGAFQVAQVSFAKEDLRYEVVRIARVMLHCKALPLNESFYAYCKLIDGSLEGITVNIYITDMSGNVLATLLGCYFEGHNNEFRASRVPDTYYLYPKEIIHHDSINRKDVKITRNCIDSFLKLGALRQLTNINIKGYQYDLTELLFKHPNNILKTNEVKVIPRVFAEAGNIIQCCGMVCQVGPAVSKWKTGDRVLSIRPTTNKLQQTFCEDDLVSIDNLSWEEGSGVSLTYGIAFYVVNNLVTVKATDIVYITDCTSRIGRSCAWLAHLKGARVKSGKGGNIPFVESHDQGEYIASNDDANLDVIICLKIEELHHIYSWRRFDQCRICTICYSSNEPGISCEDDRIITCSLNVVDVYTHCLDILQNSTIKMIKLIQEGSVPNLMTSIEEKPLSEDVHIIPLQDGINQAMSNPLQIKIDSSGTYLVTGDGNTVSLALIQWLTRRGAKHISLATRPKTNSKYLPEQLETFKRNDVTFYKLEVDLNYEGQFEKLRNQLRAIGAPVIRGIWHVGEVGFNCPFQNTEGLSDVIQFDISSARTLFRECSTLDLYYLVVICCAGFMDGKLILDQAAVAKEYAILAEERRLLKLPALSITIYPLKENTVTDPLIELQKDERLPVPKFLDVMEALLLADDPPPAVAIINQTNCKACMCVAGTVQKLQAKKRIIHYLSEQLLLPSGLFEDSIPLKHYGVDYLIGKDFVSWLHSEFLLNIVVEEILGSNFTLELLMGKLKT
ncbi:hypothetical protein LSH36_1013g01042 [Paralvinella palmiformis]|uniref:Polyketide synthase n=1 Tax=Paralvinella palmiformis TaxID=53620 RepID=A0AAD9MQQ6_9ANNE|nr:hypothetical protein LSH36_1013g01042 [Paralvinella palmiformis]